MESAFGLHPLKAVCWSRTKSHSSFSLSFYVSIEPRVDVHPVTLVIGGVITERIVQFCCQGKRCVMVTGIISPVTIRQMYAPLNPKNQERYWYMALMSHQD